MLCRAHEEGHDHLRLLAVEAGLGLWHLTFALTMRFPAPETNGIIEFGGV
jgi:hypothetical protein